MTHQRGHPGRSNHAGQPGQPQQRQHQQGGMGQPGHQTQMQPTQPQRRQRQRAQPQPRVVRGLFFVHMVIGLTDLEFFITPEDYQKVLMIWMLEEKTIILKSVYDEAEVNVVLRGDASAEISVQPGHTISNPEPVPQFTVFTTLEVKAMVLAKMKRDAAGEKGGE